ncbi:glycoside hydrolase family 104 protein [Methylobacterium sp. WL19]|uniref:glycoside hydrolase family 104 protein n=1 Tax=Methylobacterium sp. WL19 TaxID=2603896 RepID=UPI0011C9B152|nr:glycoside hydrolase family 104 protein [Methylobacterium sp. WL19]TXN33876.1 glycoside hydrolase family 104 protein [Methylobacterium sp. WL19]
MDKSVPAGAALLLDFIASYEAPYGYGTIYGNNQNKLPAGITTMRLDDVIAAQKSWTTKYGSSACGRYQFMRATLQGLKTELGLSGMEFFDPNLQDRLGYHLLKRRGYASFMSGALSPVGFGLKLAQEWASFPVLAATKGAHRNVVRGQSYYVGDGLNKALVKPEAVEKALASALKLFGVPGSQAPVTATPTPPTPPVSPTAPIPPSPVGVASGFWASVIKRLRAAFPAKKV